MASSSRESCRSGGQPNPGNVVSPWRSVTGAKARYRRICSRNQIACTNRLAGCRKQITRGSSWPLRRTAARCWGAAQARRGGRRRLQSDRATPSSSLDRALSANGGSMGQSWTGWASAQRMQPRWRPSVLLALLIALFVAGRTTHGQTVMPTITPTPPPVATPTAPGTSSPLVRSVNFPERWNLIGAPTGTAIAGSVSALYTYDPERGTYVPFNSTATLQAGVGYWAYFERDTTIAIRIDSNEFPAVPLPAGKWV